MEIYRKNDKIIFEFDEFEKRFNPWGSDEENEKAVFGKYPTFTGLIIKYRGENDYDEMGFAQTIDMDYKDKPDQVGDFLVRWFGEEKEFQEICKKFNWNIQELTFDK